LTREATKPNVAPHRLGERHRIIPNPGTAGAPIARRSAAWDTKRKDSSTDMQDTFEYLLSSAKIDPELLGRFATPNFRGWRFFAPQPLRIHAKANQAMAALSSNSLKCFFHGPTSRDLSAMRERYALSICEVERVRRIEQ